MPGWERTHQLFTHELEQMRDEGAPVDRAWWLGRLAQALRDGRAAVEALYDELVALPVNEELALREPNDLAEIRALRPKGPRRMTLPYDEATLLDRLHGAWLGRCCGCALGKPFERSPFFFGPNQRAAAEAYLRAANAWPLDFYLPGSAPVGKLAGADLRSDGIDASVFPVDEHGVMRLHCERSHRENIECMESDDDIRYTLIGLLVAEQHGPKWTSENMASVWLHHLTYMQVCTAETQAFINMIVSEGGRWGDFENNWLWVATHRNPYREWIGAQIRADHFGYAAAGNPELAAEYAWRDARISHVRNGIYGEMFIAAAIAAAFVTGDVRKIVEIALSEIPADCRLAEAIRETVERFDEVGGDWARAWDWFRFENPWGAANAVHTVPNAIVCVLGLLAGAGNFERSITHAVLGGLDTDCNGATVGSIVGATMRGADVPKKWSEPLHDTIDSAMPAYGRVSIRSLAERSLAVWKAASGK